jgi:hypothetical protein
MACAIPRLLHQQDQALPARRYAFEKTAYGFFSMLCGAAAMTWHR